MKRLSLFFMMILCSFIMFAQNGRIALQTTKGAQQECTKNAFTGFEATFSFSSIESMQVSTEKGIFSAISISNTYPSGEEGSPSLPVVNQLIAVPQGATPRVIIKSYTETEYSLDAFGINTLYPQQPSVRKDQKPEDVPFVYNNNVYASKGYASRPIAEVAMMGTLRNMRIGSLTINPVIYDAGTNKIKVRNNIEVEVVFDGADKNATQSLFEATYSPYFEPIYTSFFNRDVYDDHPDMWHSPVRMLVISNRMFENALEPWLEWKTQKGFYLDVNYTDDIGTNYNAIKTFIANKYNEGVQNGNAPTFVAIIGDVAQVPNTTGNSSQKVTDLYYASVDNDYFPDMYGFRMSAETEKQLTDMINKSLMYEKYTMPDPSYLNNVLLIAGQDGNWNPQIAQPTINYATTNYYNTDHGFTNVYAYLNSYSGCYNNLNTGVGFANYTAHGGETEWSGPSFSVSNVNALTNTNKYFWAMGNCCLACDFGYYSPCLGEAFVRAENKGAFAYIGSCPSTYWFEDYYFNLGANNSVNGNPPTPATSSTGLYDGAFMNDMYNTVNSLMFLGNIAVTYAHSGSYQTHSSPLYYWQAYHVMGDGSVMPYIIEPTENTISHMAIVPIGVESYTVEADPGSYVAISKDGVLHGVGLVDASGSVDVPITPITSGGDVMIVVTCPQRQPSIELVPAAALEGAYLVVSNYTPNNLGFGQTQNIDVTLKNVGTDPSTGNTTVTFTCNDPLLTISSEPAIFGAMAADEEISVSNAFSITASTDIEDGQMFTIVATMVNGSDTWSSNMSYTVYKPILEYDGFSWAGSFEPGQSYDIAVNFKNEGGFAATNAVGTMTTTNNYVTINNATYNYGTIDPDGSVSGIYNITIADDAPITEPITLNITIIAANEIAAEGEVILANSCNVIFALSDSYGDGWNNAKLRVTFDDGTPQVEYTFNNGSSATFTKEINTGTNVTLTWISGSYDSECSFTVSYEDGDEIYAASDPNSGVLTTFQCQCGGTPAPCDPIANLSAEVSNYSVVLSWEGTANSYIVKRNGVEIATPTTTTYTDANLLVGVYNYCVIAVCTDGNATPICESVEIDNEIFTITATAGENGTITPEGIIEVESGNSLTFTIAADETYVIQDVRVDGESVGVVAEYTFENVTANHTIEAVFEPNNINEIENSINVYPNPAKDVLFIESASAIQTLNIYNTLGQLVYTAQNCGNKTTVSVANLNSGIYMIQMTGNNHVVTKKFVVQ
ncbi:MAG: C25 family cysteine peptidase [Bacteroidales bacterium]|nr:C25 family cysteine peptidase [Bacteroidales bacterium]